MTEPYFDPPDKAIYGTFQAEYAELLRRLDLGFNAVQTEYKMMDSGGSGVNYVRFDAQPNADDTVTVDGLVYCFDPTGGVPYDVEVAIGGSVGETLGNLGDAVEANQGEIPTRPIRAIDGAGDVLLLAASWNGADSDFPLEESTGGVRLAVGSANAKSAADPKQRLVTTALYYITDEDVTTLAAGGEVPIVCCQSGEQPVFGSAIILRGGNLNVVPMTLQIGWSIRQVTGDLWVGSVQDSGAILANGDALLVTIWT
jgi:hypothetical protein